MGWINDLNTSSTPTVRKWFPFFKLVIAFVLSDFIF